MKILTIVVSATLLLLTLNACKSSSGSSTLCEACIKDSIKFTGNHPLKPTVFISAKDCLPDSISWSYDGMAVNRKTGFTYLIGNQVKLNKDFTSCFIRDTLYAWLVFNDCGTGRGYQAKLPFSKSEKLSIRSSGINAFDKKFAVADGLLAYSDRGNLFVEEMATGKSAMMTFGERVDIDYDAIHDYIETATITPTHISVKVKLAAGWKVLEKDIELK